MVALNPSYLTVRETRSPVALFNKLLRVGIVAAAEYISKKVY